MRTRSAPAYLCTRLIAHGCAFGSAQVIFSLLSFPLSLALSLARSPSQCIACHLKPFIIFFAIILNSHSFIVTIFCFCSVCFIFEWAWNCHWEKLLRMPLWIRYVYATNTDWGPMGYWIICNSFGRGFTNENDQIIRIKNSYWRENYIEYVFYTIDTL